MRALLEEALAGAGVQHCACKFPGSGNSRAHRGAACGSDEELRRDREIRGGGGCANAGRPAGSAIMRKIWIAPRRGIAEDAPLELIKSSWNAGLRALGVLAALRPPGGLRSVSGLVREPDRGASMRWTFSRRVFRRVQSAASSEARLVSRARPRCLPGIRRGFEWCCR